MRSYGRVHTAFWSDPPTRDMSERGRMLALYLLTSPHSNMVGAYLLPDAYVADDMGWTLSEVKKIILELIENGFCKRFRDGRHIAICKFLKYNPVENSNAGKSIARQFCQLPKDSALEDVVGFLIEQSDKLPESFSNDLRTVRGSHTQEQAQEQSHAHEQDTARAAPASIPEETAQDIVDAIGAYNAVAGRVGWAIAEKLSKPRLRGAALRLRECGGLDGWLALMARAEASDFLTGRAPRGPDHAGWAPDLDWFLNPKNFNKLAEGSYDRRHSNVRSSEFDNIRDGANRAAFVDGGQREGMEDPGDSLLRLAHASNG